MVSMRRSQFVLRRAGPQHLDTVLGLIGEAAQWLRRSKITTQWAAPWPDEEGHRKRIQADLDDGKTWLAWRGNRPVATITADETEDEVWSAEMRSDPAVYVSRLVVSRAYPPAKGLGAQLIEWAGLRAREAYEARWVRVDVWTDNEGLHRYYHARGFVFCGLCASIPGYPAAALFQKPADRCVLPARPLFREASGPAGGRAGDDNVRRACGRDAS